MAARPSVARHRIESFDEARGVRGPVREEDVVCLTLLRRETPVGSLFAIPAPFVVATTLHFAAALGVVGLRLGLLASRANSAQT